ncbi:hypothetical protein WJX74_005265 [Apatococcus lobatus]|uniref:NF-X1-type domain-containing protein n=1 Tax=Apatococcus lobatus TaxID=904363 RepID=A0AAW1R0R2_9CHLO
MARNTWSQALLNDYRTLVEDSSQYKDSLDPVFLTGLARLEEELAGSQSGAAVCLICLEDVRPAEATWDCQAGCHCMFHLVCIQAWARQHMGNSKLDAESLPALGAEQEQTSKKREQAGWACPKCRQEYARGEVPSKYTCFCGKVEDPPFDPWLAPHSCGQECNRSLSCPHTCSLLCHPGPCPPCPRQVKSECFCGKQTSTRRCAAQQWSCKKLCGTRLPCGHRCPHLCHPTPCPPCTLTGKHSCLCGRESAQVACKDLPFQCGQVCGRMLDCGHHSCQATCHKGECGSCPLQGPRSCPCGKAEFTDLACTEATPTCGSTCDKPLPCGHHTCMERCHHGDCTSTCRAVTLKSCHCGKLQKSMPCHEPLRCERRCTNWKECGRHQCKRRCCDGDCPPCEEVCGRKLRCGNHKCPAPCHSGPCQPCPLSAQVTCACGAQRYRLPCGAEGRAQPPPCSRPCPVPSLCRHASKSSSHLCHYGACPTCPETCSTVLPCGHNCNAACHDTPPSSIPDFTPPIPPSAPGFISVRQRAEETPTMPPSQSAAEASNSIKDAHTACPPCQAPVKHKCLGEHISKDLPCSAPKEFTCDSSCRRPLACGNHTCQKPCHAPLGSGPLAEACAVCSEPCTKPRSCAHACLLPCHPGPCPPCHEQASVPCFCGTSLITLLCSQQQDKKLLEGKKQCGKPCRRALPDCPHACQAPCHPGPCPEAVQGCQQEVTARCRCRRQRTKLPCQQARRQMVNSGQNPQELVLGQAVRLLPCTAACSQANPSIPQEKEKEASITEHRDSAHATASKAAMPERPFSGIKASRRRNREDRQREQQLAAAATQRQAGFLRSIAALFKRYREAGMQIVLLLAVLGLGWIIATALV